MRTALASLFLLFVAALACGQVPAKAPDRVQVAFDSFHNSLDELTEKFKSSDQGIAKDISGSLSNIGANVKFLEDVRALGKPRNGDHRLWPK